MDELQSLTLRLHMINFRKGTERCLTCGSKDVSDFSGDAELDYDAHAGLYVGNKKTGFKHPGCGGNIWVKACDMRLNLRISALKYDALGNKMEGCLG